HSREQLNDDARQNDRAAAPYLARPDDTFSEGCRQPPHWYRQPGGQAIDKPHQPRGGVQGLAPINRQTSQQCDEQDETSSAAPDQSRANPAWVGEGDKQDGGWN